MIVLAGYDCSEIVRSIAWEDGDGVMLRILGDDGRSRFDRRSTSATLAAEFELTSSYFFMREIRVAILEQAFWLLGHDIAVLDVFSVGHEA